MIARLVMAEAAPAVLPIWYSPKGYPSGGPSGRSAGGSTDRLRLPRSVSGSASK